MGQEVYKEVVLKGYDPRDVVLFACGGAGATHACSIAPYLGTTKVIVPSASSVFGAFGAATVKIKQVWEKSKTIKIFRFVELTFMDPFIIIRNNLHSILHKCTFFCFTNLIRIDHAHRCLLTYMIYLTHFSVPTISQYPAVYKIYNGKRRYKNFNYVEFKTYFRMAA